MKWKLAKALILSATLAAMSGHASADCTAYMADLINFAKASGPAHIQVSMTVKQGNGLSASSTPWYAYHGGPANVPEVDWDGANLSGGGGAFLFSDRYTNGNYGNPYNVYAAEAFDFMVSPSGYVQIHNLKWGAWTKFYGTCANNVLYGWGSPIGRNNGGYMAMYVISFQKLSS